MKYDDASWHYGGDFPAGLPPAAGATHIGMFLAWCLLNGYVSDETADEWGDELQDLRERRVTPGSFLIGAMDEKFISDDLNDEGNAFAVAYYEGKDNDSKYVDDYVATFDTSAAEIYGVTDTWEAFDKIAERISARHTAWIEAGRPQFII